MPTKPDWRIGLSVKVKLRSDPRYYDSPATVVAVYPSGTSGLIDETGVLHLRLPSGMSLMVRADDWVTD